MGFQDGMRVCADICAVDEEGDEGSVVEPLTFALADDYEAYFIGSRDPPPAAATRRPEDMFHWYLLPNPLRRGKYILHGSWCRVKARHAQFTEERYRRVSAARTLGNDAAAGVAGQREMVWTRQWCARVRKVPGKACDWWVVDTPKGPFRLVDPEPYFTTKARAAHQRAVLERASGA